MIKFAVIATICLSISAQQPRRHSNCPWGNKPVCGVDYITYENTCAIAAAYVEKKHDGPCQKRKVVVKETGKEEVVSDCPQPFMPVCGKDYVTYQNACTLKFNEIDMAHEGPCGIRRSHRVFELLNTDEPIMCDCRGEAFKPVCSLAGFTYENQCVLNCT